MDTTLLAEPRTSAGGNEAGRLRQQGRIPAVVYGGAGGAESVAVDPKELSRLLHSQSGVNTLISLRVGSGEPTRVLVQNGNGQPGIGEEVARLLLPHGFRVVLSQNADSFRHAATEIAATDEAFTRRASRAQELLGVGTVALSQVPSGLAAITVVVGRDFTA